MQFNVINPEDEGYNDLAASLESEENDRFDYNGLANAYNTLKVNAFTHFEFPKVKQSSLRKQLERRGLVIGVDCTAKVSSINDPFEKDSDGEYKLDKDKNKIPEKDGDGNVIPVEYHAFVRRLTDKKAEIIKVTAGRRKAGESAPGAAKTADAADEESEKQAAKDKAAAEAAKPASTGKPAGTKKK